MKKHLLSLVDRALQTKNDSIIQIKWKAHMQKRKLKELVIGGEVSRGLSGKIPHQAKAELAEIITIKDLVNGRIDTRNLEKKELVGIKDFSKVITREGDVLVAVKGSSLKTAIIDADSRGRVFSSNIISLRLIEGIQPEILVAYLNSPEGQQELNSIAKGTGIPSVNTHDLLELEIPIPPLNIQNALIEYINSVDHYLEALSKEEELIRKIKGHFVSSLLGGIV